MPGPSRSPHEDSAPRFETVAGWCFVCDVPVEGSGCPGCGRPPTLVDEGENPEQTSRARWTEMWAAVPRPVWILVGAMTVIVLFSLLQSGFRL